MLVSSDVALLDIALELGGVALERLWQLACAGLDRLGVGAGLLRDDQGQTPGSVLGLRSGTSARPDPHNRAPRP